MERLVKFAKIIRTNWKKSLVGAFAVYYGAATAKQRYDINIVMRAACKEAAQYGDRMIPMERNPTLVTVILNPVANKRKAKQDFEKYCEPLLHLAGLQVDVIQTASEGNAKEIVETLRGTEAIIVAGGDGTLSETVTGLLRRSDEANRFPLGILPLGKTNTVGNSLFPGGEGVGKVKQLINASMAIIKGSTIWKDAMKIEPIAEEDEIPNKPIYALSSLEYGAFRDTLAKKDKYWIYGPWRAYAAFIFNGYKQSMTWECSGTLKYTPPCTGCSNCVRKKPEVPKRWSFFVPHTQQALSTEKDYAKIANPECAVSQELCFKTSDFRIQSSNFNQSAPVPALSILLGKSSYSYTKFVSDGWSKLKGQNTSSEPIHVRSVEFLPKKSDKEVLIEIDKEEFEAKPVKITLLPKVVRLFCQPEINNND